MQFSLTLLFHWHSVSGVSATTIYGGAGGGNGSGNGGGAAALRVVQCRRTRKGVGRNFENLLESVFELKMIY